MNLAGLLVKKEILKGNKRLYKYKKRSIGLLRMLYNLLRVLRVTEWIRPEIMARQVGKSYIA